MRKIVIQVFIVIVSVAVLAEVVLRLTGKYATYSEANGRPYLSEYGQTMPTWYHLYTPGVTIIPEAVDFKYPYVINSQGIRDTEHALVAADSTYRILVFGDSYAQGVGAPLDSAWPQLCQQYIAHRTAAPVEVISGAVAGSDVYFNYVLHRDKLRKYEPKLVVVAVNITDYSDILLRGDISRFKADGTTQFTPTPWYEPVYARSRLVRALFNRLGGFDLTGIFISTNTYRNQLPVINNNIADILNRQKELTQKDSARFVVVLHAIPQEFIYANTTITALNTEAIKQLSALLRAKGIDVVDIHAALEKQLARKPQLYYTYMHDLHYNPTGYNLMAQCVSDSLMALGVIHR